VKSKTNNLFNINFQDLVCNKHLIFWFIVIITFILRIINLDIPLYNEQHNFRQAETAIIISSFFNDGFSLFNYEMPIMGDPWHIMFECPIYQSLVYFIMILFHQNNIDLWCKIVSIIMFYAGVPIFKKLIKLITNNDEASYFAVGCYLISTYTIYWSRGALIDYTSVFFALVYTLELFQWLDTKNYKNYIIGIVFGCLGYIQKSTTMFPYVFLLAILIILHELKYITIDNKIHWNMFLSYIKENIVRLLFLAIICIVPVIPGLMWVKHADYVNSLSPYSEGFASYNMTGWNYGTLAQRFKPYSYVGIGYNLFGFFGIGSIIIIVVFIYNIKNFQKQSLITILSLFVPIFLTISILFNLYCRHNYYYIAVSPLICAIVGIIAYESLRIQKKNFTPIIVVIIATILIQPVFNMKYLGGVIRNQNVNECAGVYVNKNTPSDTYVIYATDDWNPSLLYYCNRKGFTMTTVDCNKVYDLVTNDNYSILVAKDSFDISEIHKNFNLNKLYASGGETVYTISN